MALPERVQTLVFDYDGTLCHRRPSATDVFFNLLNQTGVEINPRAKRNTRQFIHYYWAKSTEAAEDIDRYGRMTPEFWEQYLKRKLIACGLNEGRAEKLSAELQPGMEKTYQPQKWVPADVRPTLGTLQRSGYTLGLVSNRPNSLREELAELNLIRFFDFYYTAGEINSWKPDKEIFEYALDLAQSTPESTAYIGDNYYADILGAKKVGLYAVLLDPDHTFPDADCAVIQSLGDLIEES